MKISIALSVLILAAAVGLRWNDQQRLTAARENRTKLVAEATKLGIAADPTRTIQRERERGNREAIAKAAAAEFIARAKESEAILKNGGPWNQVRQTLVIEIPDRIVALDAAQLKVVITALHGAKDLEEKFRQELISYSITALAYDRPQAMLGLFTECFDLLKDCNVMKEDLVSSSIAKWAKDDPLAALKWVRKNREKFPDFITDHAEEHVISGTAANDPKLAFKLVGEIGMKNTSRAANLVASAAVTPAARTAALAAIRDYLTTLPDEMTRNQVIASSMKGFTRSLGADGFTSASQWLAGAKFSPAELEQISKTLSQAVKRDESGQWIDWISAKLPTEKSEASIRTIMANWTEKDYQAAGKWLASTPASPTKNTAIRSYAETVSTLDPATATQWAMTLPPGPDRDATLKHIQDHPPAK